MALFVVHRLGPRLFPGSAAVRQSFWCPFRDAGVQVSFMEAQWDGRRVDVESCSFFTPPSEVRCEKACLTLATLSERAAGTAPPAGGAGLCQCWRMGGPGARS
jgi:hypothetical protein